MSPSFWLLLGMLLLCVVLGALIALTLFWVLFPEAILTMAKPAIDQIVLEKKIRAIMPMPENRVRAFEADRLLRASLRKAGVPVKAKPPKKPWAKEWGYCVKCTRTDRPHQARGYCHTCYQTTFMKPRRRSHCRA